VLGFLRPDRLLPVVSADGQRRRRQAWTAPYAAGTGVLMAGPL